MGASTMLCTWRLEDSLQKLALTFYPVVLRDRSQAVSQVGGKCFSYHLPSHLTTPEIVFLCGIIE